MGYSTTEESSQHLASKRGWKLFRWPKKKEPAASGRSREKKYSGSLVETKTRRPSSSWRKADKQEKSADRNAKNLSRSAPSIPLDNLLPAEVEADVATVEVTASAHLPSAEDAKAKRFQQQAQGERPLSSSLLEVQEAVCEVRQYSKLARKFTSKLDDLHKSKPAIYGATLLPSNDAAFWMEQFLDSANSLKEEGSSLKIGFLALDDEIAKGVKDSRQNQTRVFAGLVAGGLQNKWVEEPFEDTGGQGMFAATLTNTIESAPLLPLVFCPKKRMRAVSKAYVPDLEQLVELALAKTRRDSSSRSLTRAMSGRKASEMSNSSFSWLPKPPIHQQYYEAPETLDGGLPEGVLCEPTEFPANLPICAICLTEIESVQEATQISKCKHTFHSKCLSDALKRSRQCSVCRDWIGECQGKQPDAWMLIDQAKDMTCAGFEPGAYVITYTIPDGVQKEYHDNPGFPFFKTQRIAYLPHNQEGLYLLHRLQMAFARGLTFTIGTSPITGLEDAVIFTSIPHKLHPDSASADSFPDANYFEVCHRELDALGVPRPTDNRGGKRWET